jgi:hypothetical protein
MPFSVTDSLQLSTLHGFPEDGPEEELTHLGTSLANIDNFGDGAHSDEVSHLKCPKVTSSGLNVTLSGPNVS